MQPTKVLMGCLAALAFASGAQADALPFFNSQFDATVITTVADGTTGYDSLAGALTDTVSLSTFSAGTTDIATAGAIVAAGLLSTSADVSALAIGSAVASAHFTGSFINGAAVSLSLDFSSNASSSGSGGAATSLFVSLTSNGVVLFSDYVSNLWTYAYTPVVGTTSVLDLTLSSEASAAFLSAGAGNGASSGLVSITGAVPEASTWMMFALGIAAVGVAGRKRLAGVQR